MWSAICFVKRPRFSVLIIRLPKDLQIVVFKLSCLNRCRCCASAKYQPAARNSTASIWSRILDVTQGLPLPSVWLRTQTHAPAINGYMRGSSAFFFHNSMHPAMYFFNYRRPRYYRRAKQSLCNMQPKLQPQKCRGILDQVRSKPR